MTERIAADAERQLDPDRANRRAWEAEREPSPRYCRECGCTLTASPPTVADAVEEGLRTGRSMGYTVEDRGVYFDPPSGT